LIASLFRCLPRFRPAGRNHDFTANSVPAHPVTPPSPDLTLNTNTELRPIARLDHVVKRYGALLALDDVSLAIHPGVTGLLGPNGSGKSTFIKAMLGLVRTHRGEGQILGRPWPSAVREIRDSVGFSPEDDCYIAGLVGIESVGLMAELSGLPRVEALRRSHEVLDFCDVGEERYREVESYSTGMRQKLKFAQALVHDPPLLILDEPTTGLDPQQRRSMLDRIATLGRDHDKTILLSTHILPDVRAVCDRVVILVRGKVRVADTLENLSRPAEPTLRVSIQGDFERFAAGLSALGHQVRRERDGTIRILGIDPSQTTRVWNVASQSDVAITSMAPARNSLEEMFFDATREHALAPEST